MDAKSWQTTAAGVIGGLGAGLLAYSQIAETALVAGVHLGALGAGMTAVAIAWGFKSARDDKVSSEGRKLVKRMKKGKPV